MGLIEFIKCVELFERNRCAHQNANSNVNHLPLSDKFHIKMMLSCF